MAEMAALLGKHDDETRFRQTFERVRRAFVDAYVDRNGKIKGHTQTAYALALAFDLLPENRRARAAKHLRENVVARGNHLGTGFVGTPYLLPMLSESGNARTAYDLLLQDTYPSWLYCVKLGATTIWERWNSLTTDHGIHAPGMNSFNHYALGAVGDWLFGYVGGIQALAPAYTRVRIRPYPDVRLGHAEVSFASPVGTIVSAWRLRQHRLTLDLTIPVNVSAEILLPGTDPRAIRESGRPASAAPGLRAAGQRDGCVVFEAGSGHYRFESPFPPPSP